MNETYSFDAMPQILASVLAKVEELSRKVDTLMKLQNSQVPADRWMTQKELCEYLPSHPSVQTVYDWTSNHLIPFHKQGKSNVFLQSEIDNWLAEKKVKSHTDLEAEALVYVQKKKKGGKYVGTRTL